MGRNARERRKGRFRGDKLRGDEGNDRRRSAYRSKSKHSGAVVSGAQSWRTWPRSCGAWIAAAIVIRRGRTVIRCCEKPWHICRAEAKYRYMEEWTRFWRSFGQRDAYLPFTGSLDKVALKRRSVLAKGICCLLRSYSGNAYPLSCRTHWGAQQRNRTQADDRDVPGQDTRESSRTC